MKDWYAKNKWWAKWFGVVVTPILWAVVIYEIYLGSCFPELHHIIAEHSVAKFNLEKFLVGVTWFFLAVFIYKLRPSFPAFFMKLTAGMLLSAMIGTCFAFALWNFEINENLDMWVFISAGIGIWGCLGGIVAIINRNQP